MASGTNTSRTALAQAASCWHDLPLSSSRQYSHQTSTSPILRAVSGPVKHKNTEFGDKNQHCGTLGSQTLITVVRTID